MKTLLSVAALVVSIACASAQLGGPPMTADAAMVKLFGDTKAFSANAQARLLDKNQKEVMAMPITMALRDGKLRSEMNISDIKSSSVPSEASAMMKQAGMDKMVTIVDPATQKTYMIYPGLKSYAEQVATEVDTTKANVEFAEVGTETIDGHSCVKKKVTTTDSKGRPQEMFVWQAKDMKNFPIQMSVPQKENTLIVKFEQPKLEAPSASLFELPADYTKYSSLQAMMQAAMMKMFSNQLK